VLIETTRKNRQLDIPPYLERQAVQCAHKTDANPHQFAWRQ